MVGGEKQSWIDPTELVYGGLPPAPEPVEYLRSQVACGARGRSWWRVPHQRDIADGHRLGIRVINRAAWEARQPTDPRWRRDYRYGDPSCWWNWCESV